MRGGKKIKKKKRDRMAQEKKGQTSGEKLKTQEGKGEGQTGTLAERCVQINPQTNYRIDRCAGSYKEGKKVFGVIGTIRFVNSMTDGRSKGQT